MKKIPLREDEKPIRGFGGYTFKNNAFHCRPEHLFPKADLETAQVEWVEALTLYFANFCEPVRNIANEIHCVACNTKLTGPQGMDDWRTRAALSVNLETKTREARCTTCGYPARCGHHVFLPTGQLVVALSWFPLQYHPHALQGNVRVA